MAVLKGLAELKVRLALVQAASLLAMEGTSRASVLAVAERAAQEYGVEVTPSEAGQTFTALGIESTLSHGKRRLALDVTRLQALQERLEGEVEEAAARVAAAVTRFGNVADRVRELEVQLAVAYRLQQREHEVRGYLRETDGLRREAALWEQRYQQAKADVEDVEQRKAACADLDKKVKALPRLEERKTALEQRLKDAEAQQEEITKQEQALAQRVARLKERAGWVSLAQLEQAIAQDRQELERLRREIGEKRTVWERLFGKRPEGGQAP